MTDMNDLNKLTFDQATPEDIAQMITELEQYRERLVNDALTMAKRAKIMQSQAQARLEPDLLQIDALLSTLREKQAILTQS
jgi:hypothetical protein